jgi:alpha-galactosidase
LETIGYADDALELRIEVDAAGLARITRLAPSADADPLADAAADVALPLVDVVLAGEGKAWAGQRYCESEAGGRLQYTGHSLSAAGECASGQCRSGQWQELRVSLSDPVTGLQAVAHYRILTGHGVLRSWVHLVNAGDTPVTVESVTSFLCAGFAGSLGSLEVRWAENDWLAEGRWQRRGWRDAIPDLNRRVHGADSRGRLALTSTGSWSCGGYLPMGALVSRDGRGDGDGGQAWVWQIEHNGGWHWQTGECTARHGGPRRDGLDLNHAPAGSATGAYVALLGPADAEHQWRVTLAPGSAFDSVPVAVAVSGAGFTEAIGRLTSYRRAIRRPHADQRNLPVIFNDYMNTLMGDPTTDRLLPLISAAADVGAEYFCIDSGWYAGLGEGWWDTVGAWTPSEPRFPGGLAVVLDRIRGLGMVPGLWLEPEMVGVHSPVAQQLPASAFVQRDGQPVVEQRRYQLDLRDPAAVKHLNSVIDHLVGSLGVGYLKLDYNIDIGPVPEALEQNRAQLEWLDSVLDRYPDLVIENCASGGLRADYALLSRLQLQSTSDQQDFLSYPPIAAAAAAAMTPEQAAVWAYPQPSFSAGSIAFTLCTAMLGRVQLSGHVDQMSPAQLELVAAAVRVYKSLRADLATAVPFWPLGLPGWTDQWIAAGMRAAAVSYLTVWHRGPAAATVVLPVPHLRGRGVTASVLYPAPAPASASVSWDDVAGELTVSLPQSPAACVLRLACVGGAEGGEERLD